MYTGFWIQNSYIYGPIIESGQYWIENSHIYGPKNSGCYWIGRDGYIYGPKDSGRFWMEGRYICGPDKVPPWLQQS